MRRVLPALIAVSAVVAVLAACNSSTGPDVDLTGNWGGTFVTTVPVGPTEPWAANLVQTGTTVTGTLNCEGLETYSVGGTNVHNALTLTLVGSISDTAHLLGTASGSGGTVSASGTFSDDDADGCFTGFGNWTGKLQ